MAIIAKNLKYGETLPPVTPTPKHGIRLNVPAGANHIIDLRNPAAEAEKYIESAKPGFCGLKPEEMNPRYLFWCAQNALRRAYFDNEDLAESKIRFAVYSQYTEGEIVSFRHGLKGRVAEVVPFSDHCGAIVEEDLDDFRRIWSSLTTAQRFDEE